MKHRLVARITARICGELESELRRATDSLRIDFGVPSMCAMFNKRVDVLKGPSTSCKSDDLQAKKTQMKFVNFISYNTFEICRNRPYRSPRLDSHPLIYAMKARRANRPLFLLPPLELLPDEPPPFVLPALTVLLLPETAAALVAAAPAAATDVAAAVSTAAAVVAADAPLSLTMNLVQSSCAPR